MSHRAILLTTAGLLVLASTANADFENLERAIDKMNKEAKKKQQSPPTDLGGALGALLGKAAGGDGGHHPAAFYESRFTMAFRETPIEDALELIAHKAGLALKTEGSFRGDVTESLINSTLDEAMEKIASDHNFNYEIRKNTLYVTSEDSEDSGGSGGGGGGGSGSAGTASFRAIPVLFANAREIMNGATKALKRSESLTVDDGTNSLILFGSDASFAKVKQYVALQDKAPKQILIEAQIVETTKNFSRDIGISWGEITNADTLVSPRFSGSVTAPGPVPPIFTLKGLIGAVDGRALDAKLTAAETTGDAKVISRPKVFTLNNRRATVHSGITYNIKTLSTVDSKQGSSGSGSGGTNTQSGTVAGGLVEVKAGLNLEVTPTIVGDDHVKMTIKVENSEPNTGAAVDGIPGIVDNSADTSILVKSGQTATMAGLMKNSLSNTRNGVPWLSRIPVLGWLFSSHSDKDLTSELMIFITPHVMPTVAPAEKDKAAPPTAEAAKDPNLVVK